MHQVTLFPSCPWSDDPSSPLEDVRRNSPHVVRGYTHSNRASHASQNVDSNRTSRQYLAGKWKNIWLIYAPRSPNSLNWTTVPSWSGWKCYAWYNILGQSQQATGYRKRSLISSKSIRIMKSIFRSPRLEPGLVIFGPVRHLLRWLHLAPGIILMFVDDEITSVAPKEYWPTLDFVKSFESIGIFWTVYDQGKSILQDCKLAHHRYSSRIGSYIDVRGEVGSLPIEGRVSSEVFITMPAW